MSHTEDALKHLTKTKATGRRPGRAIHSLDGSAFREVEKRPVKRGELFADCKGRQAWVYRAIQNLDEPEIIVVPI